jgi:hypothetical protein
MPRKVEALMAKALAKARLAGSIPPLVLPLAYRGALPFDSGTDGCPRDLHKRDGMGLIMVRFWDEIGQPANEAAA